WRTRARRARSRRGTSRNLGQQQAGPRSLPFASTRGGRESMAPGFQARVIVVPGPRAPLRADDATVAGILPCGAGSACPSRARSAIEGDRRHARREPRTSPCDRVILPRHGPRGLQTAPGGRNLVAMSLTRLSLVAVAAAAVALAGCQ